MSDGRSSALTKWEFGCVHEFEEGGGQQGHSLSLHWHDGRHQSKLTETDAMAVLTRLGSDDWELVSVTDQTSHGAGSTWFVTRRYYLKRPGSRP